MTEFDDVIRLLREHRPEATPLELDQIKQRIRRGAEPGSRRSQSMKSRLAILPGATHYAMLEQPGFADMVIRFLDEPDPR